MLMPRQTTPALQVPTLQHGPYDMATDSPEHFSLLVFYRGLHCPICMKYLLELARLVPEFEKRGVKVLALSSDNQDRAEQMAQKSTCQNCAWATAWPWMWRANGACTSAPHAA